MKFRSEKSLLFGLVIWLTVLLLLALPGVEFFKEGVQFHAGWIVCLLAAAFFLWIWFGTWYLIKEDKLYYRSGPFRGALKISDIHTLVVNNTLWIGVKPALATKGIIVRYGRYDELYISPRNKDVFVESMLTVNSEISVVTG